MKSMKLKFACCGIFFVSFFLKIGFYVMCNNMYKNQKFYTYIVFT
jgi:hypothetical protein